MRSFLALGLLITLCASASAATMHHSRHVIVRSAELEVLDLEVAAELDDPVEDRLEDLRVHEMTLRGDDGRVWKCG